MLALLLLVMAQDPAAAAVDAAPPASTAARLHGPQPYDDDVPVPPWMYFGAAAGLSLTTSVLLFFPELLLAFVSGTATAVFVLAAAPIVVGFGLHRLDPARATVPIAGAVIGDVVGVVVGGVVGALLLGPELGAQVRRLDVVDRDDDVRLVGTAAGAVLGAWVLRALGAGVGAAVGRGLSLTIFDPDPV